MYRRIPVAQAGSRRRAAPPLTGRGQAGDAREHCLQKAIDNPDPIRGDGGKRTT